MARDPSVMSMDPSQQSAGLQAVLAYYKSKGVGPEQVTPDMIRQAVAANARAPGDPEANGPNLGPVVLNLRNAGIEDASPMPARGGGRTSALPTPPVPPTQTSGQRDPAMNDYAGPPGYIPTPGPIPPSGDYPGPPGNPPRLGDAVTQGSPPQLSPPPAGAAATPPLGPDVLRGTSLMDLMRRIGRQLITPMAAPPNIFPFNQLPLSEGQRQMALPAPPPMQQIEGPPPRLALPAPAAVPQLPAPPIQGQLPAPPNVPRLPAPQPNIMNVPGFAPELPARSPTPALTPGVPDSTLAPPVKSTGGALSPAIDKALQPPAVEQAPVKSRKRARRR